jgi:hypothetical protein
MRDPVVAADGFTYERAAAEAWMVSHSISPMTGAELEHQLVVANHVLRIAISEWRDQQPGVAAAVAAGGAAGAGAGAAGGGEGQVHVSGKAGQQPAPEDGRVAMAQQQ